MVEQAGEQDGKVIIKLNIVTTYVFGEKRWQPSKSDNLSYGPKAVQSKGAMAPKEGMGHLP